MLPSGGVTGTVNLREGHWRVQARRLDLRRLHHRAVVSSSSAGADNGA